MSLADALWPRMERAIADALAEVFPDGAFYTGFAGLLLYLDDEGDPSFALVFPDDQPIISSAGIARALDAAVQAQLNDMFTEP